MGIQRGFSDPDRETVKSYLTGINNLLHNLLESLGYGGSPKFDTQTAKIHYFSSRYCPPSIKSTDELTSFDAHKEIMYLHYRFPTIVEIPHLNIETPLLHLSAMEKCEAMIAQYMALCIALQARCIAEEDQ